MQATIQVRRSRYLIFLIALTLFGTLVLGGAGGYMFKSLQSSGVVPSRSTGGTAAVDILTGYPSGSGDDLRILALLKQSGYEGGGTVVQRIDPLTGYASGGGDDQRILALLKQSGYEGGGTVVRG
jgi:hypothetical protein